MAKLGVGSERIGQSNNKRKAAREIFDERILSGRDVIVSIPQKEGDSKAVVFNGLVVSAEHIIVEIGRHLDLVEETV